MKNLLIIVLLSLSINASEFVDITLKDYVKIIAKQRDISIIIDNSIDKKFSLFISSKVDKKMYFDILETILRNNDLKLQIRKNHFYITSLTNGVNTVHKYKFNYINDEDIKELMSLYTYKSKYIKNLKTLFVESTSKQFKKLESIFKNIDMLPKQLKLKVTILDTNIAKAKEYGINNELNIKSNKNESFFFNLLAFPFTVSNTVTSTQSTNLTSFIKFMNSNNLTEILSSPTITIFDNKTSLFEVVKNIPYKLGETILDNDITKTTSSYNYKDVGLKIEVLPTINDNDVFLDIDLTSENILDTSETPSIAKRHIKQYVSLKKNEIFVLTGINQKETFKENKETPFLSKMWGLGWLFKNKNEDIKTSNLTILLEVI
ncbi:MAG: hypothetical protein WA916_06095 [Arcobacter sp.]|uniref:type II secretion system protein GspD n=1 Tax=Arcobacter sp. TaxID=1872629 RepID=UPI003C767085